MTSIRIPHENSGSGNRIAWAFSALAAAATIVLSLAIPLAPAHAVVAYMNCQYSHELSRGGISQMPGVLTRMEIGVNGGKETILARPPGYDQPQFAAYNPIQILSATARRPPPLKNEAEARERNWDALQARPSPIIDDGRYVILVPKHDHMQTPANKERVFDCHHNSESLKFGFQLMDNIGYAKCNETCSNLSGDKLIDAFFLPSVRRKAILTGYESFGFRNKGALGDRMPFLVMDHDVFRPDRYATMRTGSDGRKFHPEVFEVDVTIRDPKPGIFDYFKATPLVLAIHAVKACPDGDTATACAPEETQSRAARVRSRHESYCGTSCLNTPRGKPSAYERVKEGFRKINAAMTCKTDEECLDVYLNPTAARVKYTLFWTAPPALALVAAWGWRRRRRILKARKAPHKMTT